MEGHKDAAEWQYAAERCRTVQCVSLSLTDHGTAISRLKMLSICPVMAIHDPLFNALTTCQSQLPRETEPRTQLQQQLFHDTGVRVTTQTIRNHLHVAHLRAGRPNIVLPLNANHRQARSVWC